MAVTQRSLALVLMSSRRIGSVLRTMREAKGLTQLELGRRAKVTNIYISMLELSKKKDPRWPCSRVSPRRSVCR